MSIISGICADMHNIEITKWKERFDNCKTFEEFKIVLEEFKKLEFSE